MSGPKHLWSGDWETESARTADALATAPRPVFDGEPEPEQPATPARRWSRRQLVIALTTGVAAAAVTVGLVSALGAGPSKPRSHKHVTAPPANGLLPSGGRGLTPQACQQNSGTCTPSSSVTVTGPYANWLGMQIVTSPAGIVISAIRLGSAPDQVGFEPGDRIMQIDGHQINSINQIRQDTDRIPLGKPVTIKVLRASVISELASVPMTERPTIHP